MSSVAEAVTEVLGERKPGVKRTRRGKFADLPTLATGRKPEKPEEDAKGEDKTAVREDAWGGKPGTNWKQVTPENRRRVAPLVRHYMGKAHPFTSCVRDNTKRFGEERAKRVCAVVKDMGKRTTKWREGPKKAQEALVDELSAQLIAAADGDVGLVQEMLLEPMPPVERAVQEALVR